MQNWGCSQKDSQSVEIDVQYNLLSRLNPETSVVMSLILLENRIPYSQRDHFPLGQITFGSCPHHISTGMSKNVIRNIHVLVQFKFTRIAKKMSESGHEPGYHTTLAPLNPIIKMRDFLGAFPVIIVN